MDSLEPRPARPLPSSIAAGLGLLLLFTSATGWAGNSRTLGAERPTGLAPEDGWVCPPCGEPCHARISAEPGACAGCGMALVERDSVPNVAVLLSEDVDALTATAPLALFAASKGCFVYTVADTTDPIRVEDSLTIVPDHDLTSAPAPDVLVLPSGYGALWDDEYVMEWVTNAARDADQILAIGTGSVVLARTGLLPENATVATEAWIAGRAAELVPGASYAADLRVRRIATMTTVRDAASAIPEALAVIERLSGTDRAVRAATRHGFEPVGEGR